MKRTFEALVANIDVVLDGEGPLTVHKKVLVHFLVEGSVGAGRGVVTIAQPVKHLLVGEQAGIVHLQQLSAEFLLRIAHLSW